MKIYKVCYMDLNSNKEFKYLAKVNNMQEARKEAENYLRRRKYKFIFPW